MDYSRFKKLPIMGILRTSGEVCMEDLVESIVASGLETIEIAMNSDSADALIARAVKTANARLAIGAGTVLNLDTLKMALDSGATFIVMPTLIEEVVEYCVRHVIPVFPGAMSPREIYNAWGSGATMVKVFPSSVLGPSYIKEIKGPFNNIELLACGGVNTGNIKDYFNSGASAVAFGGSIFRDDWIHAKKFLEIENGIRNLIANAK